MKVGRCRVRDMVSCFYPRLISPEEQHGMKMKSLPKTWNNGGHVTRYSAEPEPRFAEEDYIVFCFGEDGEVHMINEGHITTKTSTEKADQMQAIINEVERPNSSKIDSFKSCDSKTSDTSTSSFAFPVLGMEWIGSPVHMPNIEIREEQESLCRRCCRF